MFRVPDELSALRTGSRDVCLLPYSLRHVNHLLTQVNPLHVLPDFLVAALEIFVSFSHSIRSSWFIVKAHSFH